MTTTDAIRPIGRARHQLAVSKELAVTRATPFNSAGGTFCCVPLLMLITPLFNTAEPALFGMPYFYWYQFMFVFVGVVCVAVVFATTRNRGRTSTARQRRSGVVDPGAGR